MSRTAGKKLSRIVMLLTCVFLYLLCFAKTAEAAAPSLAAELNADETSCSLQMTDYTMPADGQNITVAVWSAKGGQDDIKWRTLSRNTSGYGCSFQISEHADSGKYYAHAYLQSKNGSMSFLKDTSFDVQPASAQSVVVSDLDQTAGKCKVTVAGVSSPSGVTAVKVPVWSKSNQSDIIWYAASKTGDGSWVVNVDFAKHGGASGTYHIHAYATSNNRTTDFIGNTKTEYSPGQSEKTVITATVNSPECSIKATGLKLPGGISNVQFAVWSAADGQDDLHWVKADYNESAATAAKTISLNDYCDYGLYYVHTYVTDKSGKMTYAGDTTFDLPAPSVGSVDIEVNGKAFSVKISGISCVGGIDRIMVPIWSQSNQSDIVWYNAAKQSDGSYQVKSDLSKHQNNIGKFNVHVYVYDGRDSYGHCAKTTSFEVSNSTGKISVEGNGDLSAFKVRISDLSLLKDYQSLLLPVWSANKGQDDLHWYETQMNGNSCEIDLPMSNHGDDGIYHLHLYGKTQSGSLELIQAYQFEINRSNRILFENSTGQSVDVKVKLSSDLSASKVMFPAWCANDQSDIVWYTATKQSDGSYKAMINVANHQNHSGTYKVHAYYYDSTGAAHFLDGTTVELLYTAVTNGQAEIRSCTITGGNTVTVTAAVTAGGTYGLFRLPAGQSGISPSATPLATVNGSGVITLNTPLNAGTSSSLLNEKLVVAQKRSTGYVVVSNGCYITNPEAIAANTRAFPTASSKKGLQVNLTMAADAAELGVKHSVINVVLSNIPCQSGGISYNYNGKTWHMDMGYVYSLDQLFAEQAANGSIVSAVLLMPWDSEWQNLIIPSGRTPGYSFYGLNAEEAAAREQLAAIFSFLANRYSDSGHNVVNWILGNEVSDYTHYNWCGNIGLQQYAAYYAHAFRLLYNSVKSQYSNARVYISLDHVWNYSRSYGFKGMDLFNAFVNELRAEGDINWNIAFHPYPNPITSPNFWKNRQGVTNSSSSNIFTMLNLQYLTDYIKNTYGSQHRFILSETGFTSYSAGVHDEKLQAAAIAYGYYLAESNDMVDSFVIHRHVDHPAETNQGLYLGLWYTNSAYDEIASTKKFSWTVFKYMDTSQGAAYTNFALPIIGADSWNSIVPGYSAARYS